MPSCLKALGLCLLVFVLPGRAKADVTLASSSFSLSFSADGRPLSCLRNRDRLEMIRPGSEGFYLEGPDGARVRFTDLSLRPQGRLLARTEDGTGEVLFRVASGARHVALRVEEVTGVPPDRLESLHFSMNVGETLRVLDLGYMTRVENRPNQLHVAWDAFWHRSPDDPPGGFALYEKTDEADEDETLLRLWVEEGLPHPAVQGAWTVERAREWVAAWQERFAVRDQLILAGKTLDELRDGVAFARRAGMKQVYLFTDTWRPDPFWPVTELNWEVNRAVFPKGETDLREFSDFVRSQGMYLALHYVSGGIGLRDPQYVGKKPDQRLASWGAGTLAEKAEATDPVLRFKPMPGVLPPTKHRPAYPDFFQEILLWVGDELVRVGQIEENNDGTWSLKGCRRGQGSAAASAHPPGEKAVGLLLAYGQNLVPDSDSTLLGEVAGNYAGLLNRCVVEHVEFDGAEIHRHDGWWGYRKFATLVYQVLDHPTTAHDSRGSRPPSWFEYRLNSSQRLMRGACSYTDGNYSVPVALATPGRPATSLLDAHFALSQGNLGGALGISKPEPMFGVTPQVLAAHGLTEAFLGVLSDWRAIDALLTHAQRQRIDAFFSPPQGRTPFNHHLMSQVVPVARKTGDRYEVVPTQVLTRAEGDISWQNGQEHGPISPRQFLRPGDKLTLVNPLAAQPPRFILHVLPAFDSGAVAAKAGESTGVAGRTATDLFTSGNGNGGGAPGASGAAGNVSLLPADAKEIRQDGPTRVGLEKGALVLSAVNSGTAPLVETDHLPVWGLAVDMTRRRGMGMWVAGDGSGAMLLVELGRRDYVVPLDFADRRYIEIPNGEVSWARGDWGWRMETKSTDYSRVRGVKIGFGRIPPGRQVTARVEQLAALGEIAVPLDNPVVHVGDGRLLVRGSVASGHFLQYDGGDGSNSATEFDENWHPVARLPVENASCVVPAGNVPVSVTVETPGPSPWLDVQFLATDAPIPVGS